MVHTVAFKNTDRHQSIVVAWSVKMCCFLLVYFMLRLHVQWFVESVITI